MQEITAWQNVDLSENNYRKLLELHKFKKINS